MMKEYRSPGRDRMGNFKPRIRNANLNPNKRQSQGTSSRKVNSCSHPKRNPFKMEGSSIFQSLPPNTKSIRHNNASQSPWKDRVRKHAPNTTNSCSSPPQEKLPVEPIPLTIIFRATQTESSYSNHTRNSARSARGSYPEVLVVGDVHFEDEV